MLKLLLALLITTGIAGAPTVTLYDKRVGDSWNNFAEESKSWTSIKNNTLTTKARSQMEKAAWSRVVNKWELLKLEVESLE